MAMKFNPQQTVRLNTETLVIEVRDGADWHVIRAACRTLDEAKAAANLAHNTLRKGGDAADAVIAVISSRYDHSNGMIDMGEYVWGMVNMSLGMCPDGCCGGRECLPESEWPAWTAWRDKLVTTVMQAV